MPTCKEKLSALKELYEENLLPDKVYIDMVNELIEEYVNLSAHITIKPKRKNFWKTQWDRAVKAGNYILRNLLLPIVSTLGGNLVTGEFQNSISN
ncbi:hypothetical protein Glove_487g58 [Diversispora epigaea]|uniref:Uncharacterized protein n=1 Tax=Diversispora epigaea TaxID=1348612 RepID=A0A397GIZ9_9GLOM|nr:hypothetical protein Glove_487g58 [Diversispora epigaea]